MKTIGTVLPTKASLAANDRYARDLAANKAAVARKKLAGLECRTVGGEVRYYRSERVYAVVGKSLNVLWFKTRDDGDYAM